MLNNPTDLDMALRDGLRHLPTPQISTDFDSRVLASLAKSPAWHLGLWQMFRPLLTGTACSLTVMLLALFWVSHAPQVSVRPAPPVPESRPFDTAALDVLLDRPRLSAGAVIAWSRNAPLDLSALGSPAPEPRSETPRRRASRLPLAFLAA